MKALLPNYLIHLYYSIIRAFKVDDLRVCMVPAVDFGEVVRVGSLGPTSICSSTGGAAWDVCALPIWSN